MTFAEILTLVGDFDICGLYRGQPLPCLLWHCPCIHVDVALHVVKDVIRNRFNFILEERVKFSEQNSENLMKIG